MARLTSAITETARPGERSAEVTSRAVGAERTRPRSSSNGARRCREATAARAAATRSSKAITRHHLLHARDRDCAVRSQQVRRRRPPRAIVPGGGLLRQIRSAEGTPPYEGAQVAPGQEARALTGVAGGPDLVDLDQQSVAVAVEVDGLDVLAVP